MERIFPETSSNELFFRFSNPANVAKSRLDGNRDHLLAEAGKRTVGSRVFFGQFEFVVGGDVNVFFFFCRRFLRFVELHCQVSRSWSGSLV